MSTRPSSSLLFAPLLALCVACPGGGKDSDSGAECVVLANENNFSWTGSLNIPKYVTAEHVDVHIDFSGLTEDLLCHPIDPVADVASVGLTRFPHLSTDEIALGLTDNSLLQSDTNGYVSCLPEDPRTYCDLSEFNFAGTAYDTVGVYEEAGGAFLLSFSGSTDPASDAVWLAFLEPTPGSVVTDAVITPTCDVVDYTVTMDTLTALSIPGGAPGCIDWSALTVSGNGEPLLPGKLDEVLIGHYTESASDIAANFLDLEQMATEEYTLELTGGTEADLSGAVSAEGAPFTGFTTDGTWILGLRCTGCTNPVPMFLTVVDPS